MRRLTSHRGPFLQGLADVAPILIGVVPFGLIAGFAAVDAGLSIVQASGFSVIIFAGASQLAAIDLIRQDAEFVVIVATALVINARMLMYAASLSPHYRELPLRAKAGIAYLLTDQAYAVSISRFGRADMPLPDRVALYLGAALALWTTWQTSTIIGAAVGTGVPDELSLDFAIPLVFLALVVPAVIDRPTLTAAAVSGTVAVAAAPLDFNLGLLIAAVSGIVAGLIVPRVAT